MAKKDVEKTESKATPTPWAGWWPQHPMTDLRRQMDDLFDEFSRGMDWPALWSGRKAAPAPAQAGGFGLADVRVEVNETDKAYEVVAELPGLDDKDVDVELANGMLTIKGEKSSAREEKDKEKNCFFSERSYGSFRRSFRVPENVDQDKIAADFSKGVLTVKLPKTPEAQSKAKKIDVKSK